MKTVYSSLMILALGLFAIPASAGSAGGCCADGAAATTTAATCSGAAGGVTASLASASPMHDMDMDMSAAVEHSGAIAAILAADETKGVAGHADGMAKALGIEAGEHAGHDMKGMSADEDSPHAAIAAQLAILSDESVSITDARGAFLSLEEAFIPLAEAAYTRQDGEPEWAVYHCGMAKGSWIQPTGEVANPFYGSKMQHCGKKITALGAGGAKDTEDHGAHGAH